MGKTLRRYVAREVLGGFLTGLALFTFVLLVARILDLVDLLLARGVPATQVVRLVGYILPSFLEIAIPLAVLLGVVAAFGRLSADGEMLAMRAAGVSLYQTVPAAAAIGAGAATAVLAIGAWAAPWAQRNVSRTLYDIARTRATAAVRPAVFNSLVDGVVLFVERVDPDAGRFDGILLSDERDPAARTTVVAGTGYVLADPDADGLYLRLVDGTSFTARAGDSHDTTSFAVLEVSLTAAATFAAVAPDERRPEQMYPGELIAAAFRSAAESPTQGSEMPVAQRAESAVVEIHRRASFAAAAFVFALVGVPLGVRPRRSVRARGLTTSLAIAVLYYVALTASVASARRGILDAALAMWVPNALVAAAALVMLGRTAADRSALPSLGGFVRGFAPAARLASAPPPS